jgi:glucokinase
MTDADSAVLAVDVGGTTVKGALVDLHGRPLHEVTADTFPVTATPVADVVTAVLAELAGLARRSGRPVVGAGVVTPGIVDESTGRVGFAANLGWRDFDLRGHLEQRLAVPVVVGHDVRAAGAAEALLGAARGSRDLAFVALGTGIAAALVTSGAVVTGAGCAAGEIGHMPVYPDGRRCPCGQVGCLEVYASGAAVARRYAELGGRAGRTAEDVVAALGADAAADQAWDEAVRALALASWRSGAGRGTTARTTAPPAGRAAGLAAAATAGRFAAGAGGRPGGGGDARPPQRGPGGGRRALDRRRRAGPPGRGAAQVTGGRSPCPENLLLRGRLVSGGQVVRSAGG